MVSRIAHLKITVDEENIPITSLYSTIETFIFGKDKVSVFQDKNEYLSKYKDNDTYYFNTDTQWVWVSGL